jgi:hypothetical protein
MPLHRAPGLQRFAALLLSAVAAGTLSTVAQILLWIAFADAWPAILFRDARLTAAIVMGSEVLPPPETFDLAVMAVATAVHLTLSFVYIALVVLLVDGRTATAAATLGAGFGLVLYAVNMHVFTSIYPWFVQARDWTTVAAHLVFGLVAALTWRVVAADRLSPRHGDNLTQP